MVSALRVERVAMASSLLVSRTRQSTLETQPLGKKRSRRKERGLTARARDSATKINRKCKDGLIRPFTYFRGLDASVAKYLRTSKTWGKKKE